jgi:hypothetical protein
MQLVDYGMAAVASILSAPSGGSGGFTSESSDGYAKFSNMTAEQVNDNYGGNNPYENPI